VTPQHRKFGGSHLSATSSHVAQLSSSLTGLSPIDALEAGMGKPTEPQEDMGKAERATSWLRSGIV
jgi:hypothetical protein